MSEEESELDNTGNLVGGLIMWSLVALGLFVAAMTGYSWVLWVLIGWCALLVMDFLQAHMRNKEMYVRWLSELWWLPI